MKKIVVFLVVCFMSIPAFSSDFPEKYYQNLWCSSWGGIQEYKLKDKTRIDCLTKNYAVEFDYAPKWAESIGQSLHYANETNKTPAIILIIEKPTDWKYYNNIKKLCLRYNIVLWYMTSPKYNIYYKGRIL